MRMMPLAGCLVKPQQLQWQYLNVSVSRFPVQWHLKTNNERDNLALGENVGIQSQDFMYTVI